MELEICTKTFEIYVKKLGGNFPLSTLCLSMASISCLVDAFSEILEQKKSLVEGQQLQQKDREEEKRGRRKKNDKKRKAYSGGMLNHPESLNFDFNACVNKKVVKPAARTRPTFRRPF